MSFVYLDHNATTPPHGDVLEAMARASQIAWANPASLHAAGRAARRVLDECREAVAKLAGVSARDVILTSGGTEANNMALARPFADNAGLLVTSVLEHPSIVRMAEELARRGVRVVWLPIGRDGILDPAEVAAALATRHAGEPALVAVHAVHSETGTIQPIADLIAMAEAADAEIHVDAVQAAGRVDPELWRGAHTASIAAHKLRGPKGIGALVHRPTIAPRPLLFGGAQERGLRPGTSDPVSAAGFTVAATRALDGPARYAALAPLRDRAEAALLTLPATATLGEPRAPHVTHVLVDGWAGDELVAALDLAGICVSSGSACSAGTAEPSRAISALVGEVRARSSLRVSLGETSAPSDVDALAAALRTLTSRAT